jgi:hypothetical protein
MFDRARQFFGRATSGWNSAEPASGRPSPPPERKTEDQILPQRKRFRQVSALRDSYRNNTFPSATAQQLKINVVGSQGGRLTLTTGNPDWNEAAGKWWSRWSRNAEFTNGLHLNELLQLVLVQLTHTSGDCILLFDDGAITGGAGCGKIRMFEGDEIADIGGDVFRTRYGARGYTQSNGMIYDRHGRHIGAFVSTTQRGSVEFAEGTYLTLLRDPDEPPEAAGWLRVGQFWRPNQGRGIPTSAHIANTIDEMDSAVTSELSAAKLNSHIALQLIEEKDATPDSDDIDRGIAGLAPVPAETPGDGEPPAGTPAAPIPPQEESIDFQMLKSGVAGIWSAPPGKKLSTFDTHRPNLQLNEFVRDLKGDAVTPYGMGLLYLTLNPEASYTAFRGAMLMAWGTFEQLQKKFERSVLDWVAVVAINWAHRRGFIPTPPEDFGDALAWAWPVMREVNETDAQSALEKKFGNSETNLLQRHGADWRKFVDQQSDEIEYCQSKGVTHPSLRTANGGVTVPGNDPAKNGSDDERKTR